MTLAASLAATAPLSVAAWMARCNAHYYATRDPLGSAGDFTTAPEISQMFGELIGLWAADMWLRAGSPTTRLVEMGPGRGTLMTDMLRSMTAAKWSPEVVFVETSPALVSAQHARHPTVRHCGALDEVPDDAPLVVVANEFFDALPVRQFVRAAAGWHERMVAATADGFVPVAGPADAAALVPAALAGAPDGSVVETCPTGTAIVAEVGARLRAHGGAALIVDYGHVGPVTGDTLQAVRGHARADPLADPGEADLTCHVDFAALAAAAGVEAWGPVPQGDFLRALGIDARAATLTRSNPGEAGAIAAAVDRLTGDAAMGRLFKVMALTGPGWPQPAGFA